MGKADLHIHSAAGDGMADPAQILEYVEHHTDLDVIAITDHDMLEGAIKAREIIARGNGRVQFIVGCEITTLEGHILAYDIEQPIRMLQPLARTLELIHAQGGFAVVPHPMSWLTRSLGRRGLLRIMASPIDGAHLDGIEVLNPTLAGRVVYRQILELNAQLRLPETAGSDSHTLETIGSAHTQFEGRTADDFRRALKAGTTVAQGTFWGKVEHQRLARIAGRQLYKAWVTVPIRHIQRALMGK